MLLWWFNRHPSGVDIPEAIGGKSAPSHNPASRKELFHDTFEDGLDGWVAALGILVVSTAEAHSGSHSAKITLANFSGVGFAVLQRPFTPSKHYTPDVELWLKGPTNYQVSPAVEGSSSVSSAWTIVHAHQITGTTLTLSLLTGTPGDIVYLDDVILYDKDNRPPWAQAAAGPTRQLPNGSGRYSP